MKLLTHYIRFLLFFVTGAAFAEINIVYHIATLNNWEDIVREQIGTMETSGLGQACDSMTVTVVGEQIEKVYPLFAHLSFLEKVHIVHSGTDLQLYEFPGIEKVQQIAHENPHAYILYLHSKGVTRYGSRHERPALLWRRYMEYFTVERWEECIQALKTADICGVEWLRRRAIFAGNFWWARASYVRTCRLDYQNRWSCENFIGTGHRPVVKNFHLSGQDLYTFAYEDHYYRTEHPNYKPLDLQPISTTPKKKKRRH